MGCKKQQRKRTSKGTAMTYRSGTKWFGKKIKTPKKTTWGVKV